MINDLPSYYNIGNCPKCGKNNQDVKYVCLTYDDPLQILEYLKWICIRCGFEEKSKTLDDSK